MRYTDTVKIEELIGSFKILLDGGTLTEYELKQCLEDCKDLQENAREDDEEQERQEREAIAIKPFAVGEFDSFGDMLDRVKLYPALLTDTELMLDAIKRAAKMGADIC